MADPPPVPAASTLVSPPITKVPIVDLRTGLATLTFVSFLTEFWAAVAGDGGFGPTLDAIIHEVDILKTQVTALMGQVGILTAKVATIFLMHGDGTLAADGELTVTKTNGVPFAPSATVDTTDADNITAGTVAPARIADNSLPYAKLVNAAGAGVLGASAAGPVALLAAGRGISFAGSAVTAQDPITTVGTLGAATAGFRAFVTDSTVAAAGNFGNVVVGGGLITVPVFADGAAWRIG